MRSAIGEMELDDIFHNRTQLNSAVKASVQEAAAAWGMEIKRSVFFSWSGGGGGGRREGKAEGKLGLESLSFLLSNLALGVCRPSHLAVLRFSFVFPWLSICSRFFFSSSFQHPSIIRLSLSLPPFLTSPLSPKHLFPLHSLLINSSLFTPRRYEITEVRPDRHISDAMDKQAAAERNRREKVLEAEGEKTKATLESEGIKIRLQNESDGALIKVKNESEAEKFKLMVEAEGTSKAMILKAEAQAESIKLVASQLQAPGGEAAAKFALAVSYSEMMGEIGKESNTMFFEKEPGNVNALLAKAGAAFETGKGLN